MPREVSGLFVGNAGEFYVLAELTRRGWTAALTARNNHAFDILARRNEESVAIRVKSKTSGFELFQWNAKKNGDIFLEMSDQKDFCVLVDIPEEEIGCPTYYVVPTPMIDKWLREDFHTWVTTPGARGQQRAEDNKRRLFYVDNRVDVLARGYAVKLAQYKGAWHLLSQ